MIGKKMTKYKLGLSSKLAQSYSKFRPEYSEKIREKIIEVSLISKNQLFCDIGAGVEYGSNYSVSEITPNTVVAIEPNIEMTKVGKMILKNLIKFHGIKGTGESTKKKDSEFDLVTFG